MSDKEVAALITIQGMIVYSTLETAIMLGHLLVQDAGPATVGQPSMLRSKNTTTLRFRPPCSTRFSLSTPEHELMERNKGVGASEHIMGENGYGI